MYTNQIKEIDSRKLAIENRNALVVADLQDSIRGLENRIAETKEKKELK